MRDANDGVCIALCAQEARRCAKKSEIEIAQGERMRGGSIAKSTVRGSEGGRVREREEDGDVEEEEEVEKK